MQPIQMRRVSGRGINEIKGCFCKLNVSVSTWTSGTSTLIFIPTCSFGRRKSILWKHFTDIVSRLYILLPAHTFNRLQLYPLLPLRTIVSPWLQVISIIYVRRRRALRCTRTFTYSAKSAVRCPSHRPSPPLPPPPSHPERPRSRGETDMIFFFLFRIKYIIYIK